MESFGLLALDYFRAYKFRDNLQEHKSFDKYVVALDVQILEYVDIEVEVEVDVDVYVGVGVEIFDFHLFYIAYFLDSKFMLDYLPLDE